MFHLNKKNKTFIFLSLYLTLLIGFFLNENSTGGALIDFKMRLNVIEKFNSNFIDAFKNYEKFGDRHSPVILIILSALSKIGFNIEFIRLIHLQTLILISIMSYKCLILKFPRINRDYFFLISLVFLLSPVLRSNAIWPDSRVFGYLLFLCSLFYFLKFEKDKKFKNCIYNNILLISSAYVSPNFSLFFIYFFYHYLKYFGLSKKIIYIILINCFLSLPMFFYLFIFKVNFLSIVAIPEVSIFTRLNISNKILIISTLIIFYLIPFGLNKYSLKNFYKCLNFKKIFFPFILFVVCFIFFDYSVNFTGGGIFYKLSYYLFDNDYIFHIIALISLIIITTIFKLNLNNIFLFLILILSNPQLTIYHKYYDPLLILLYFLLFKFKIDIKKIINKKFIYNIYGFYLSFLAINLSRDLISFNY